VKTRERSFDRGALIFREGESGDSLFLVESGRIELEKIGPDGRPVVVATIGPYELLGEMGAVDGAPHGVSARALESTKLRAIPRKDFKSWLQQEPDVAAHVMATLVARLRAADAAIAGQRQGAGTALVVAGAAGPRPGLFGALASWLRSRRPKGEGAGPVADTEVPFKIGLALLNNDVDAAWTRALAGTLENHTGIAVRVLEVAVPGPMGVDQTQVYAAALRGRQTLAQVGGELDLLLWGDVHEEGFSLWFTSAGTGTADEDRPGSFGPYLRLDLPPELDPPLGDILYVAILAAIEPQSEPAAMRQRRLLPTALDMSDDPVKSLPASWGPVRGRTALTVWGHACATRAGIDGDVRWYDRAQQAYRAALQRLPRNEHGLDEALLRRHLGAVLLALGERKQDATMIEGAVGEFRAAVESLLKTVHPQEWAADQNRLGMALYRLDLLTGRTDLLREALTAFQAALTVFNRAEAPARWAEVMNNLAQVLQVFGDQTKSIDVLERAVEVSRSAADVRSRERNPIAWASSQNSLGSALFLLDKHRGTAAHLEDAANAFANALDVYRAMGAIRPASVTEKNLARARQLLKEREARKVAKPDWAAEGKK
jgi:CRP-like cAMP-binding protein/tetratricopeptide (TPR) repeat protein